LQCVAVCYMLWNVCCSVLQCVAVCCNMLQCRSLWCSMLKYGAVWCGMMQCVAVCCSVLQCVAVCCSVLQCVAVSKRWGQVTRGHVLERDSFMCVTWLIHVWHDSFTCETNLSRVSELCHPWVEHVTCEWVMSHMNKSRHIWTSHVTYEWVMSHMNERVITLTCDMTHSMCVHTSQVLTPNATDLYSKSKRGLLHECPTHVHCWVLWLGSLLHRDS